VSIRVLIADDHAIVREGLKRMALEDPEIDGVAECSNGSETLVRIREDEFDVLVLDLSLPDISGFDILCRVKAEKPKLPVLILSMEREEEFAVRCLHAGASGYLEKRGAPGELVKAIRRVASGRKYVSAETAERLALELRHRATDRPHDLLTQREFEVFLSLASGKAVSQIAGELGISVKTVSNHRMHILQKLGVHTTADMIRYAIRHQLIR